MYFEKPYYLAPTKGGEKVYSLLRQALEATNKVAVATFVMHQRQRADTLAGGGENLLSGLERIDPGQSSGQPL